MSANADEWGIIKSLLPVGWEEAAREQGAFQRVRYTDSPASLLRLLLFHAVSGGGLRATTAQAKAAGIASMSPVALQKRLRTSGDWLEWIARELCQQFRTQPRLPQGLRPRVIDSTTIQAPASRKTDWRLHFMLDLLTLQCDWHELTDASGGEAIERAPMRAGDVILGDRNFFRSQSVRAVVEREAHVVVRMRWQHGRMLRESGRPFKVLPAARRLRVGQVGEWNVRLLPADGKEPIAARVVAVRLPAPVAKRAEKRAKKTARRKGKKIDDRTLQAAHFIAIFTTLPAEQLSARDVLEIYRHRWQVELSFKRLKQLLRLGRLPHKDKRAARSWILAKLVVALLLEKLYRNAQSFFPWGYPLEAAEGDPAEAT
jgi:hypothetical protein